MTLIEKMRGVAHSRAMAAIAGATLAVLLGGGTAVAADMIGTRDIKDGAVTKPKVHQGAVGSWEVLDRTLVGGDIKEDSVGQKVFTPELREQINEPGPQGEQGPAGADGKDGVSGYEVVGRSADRVTVAAGTTEVINTRCASTDSGAEQQGEVAMGGGAQSVDGGMVTINASYPDPVEQVSEPDENDPAGRWGARGWTVQVTNEGVTDVTVQPWALCALMN